VIAWDIEQVHIQQGDQVFKVLIAQIAAADDHLDAAEVSLRDEIIDLFNFLVTYGKDLHCQDCPPETISTQVMLPVEVTAWRSDKPVEPLPLLRPSSAGKATRISLALEIHE
jgi:hypothetical protein